MTLTSRVACLSVLKHCQSSPALCRQLAGMSADKWAEPNGGTRVLPTALEKQREEVEGNEEAKVPPPDRCPAETSELPRNSRSPDWSGRQEVTSEDGGGGARREKVQRRKKTSKKVSGVVMILTTWWSAR